MLVVGLTGGIGSGKSTTASYFAKKGICLIDADQIARDLVSPGSNALLCIARHFGAHILTAEGALKRSSLKSLVFNDTIQKAWLENLLHPLIKAQIQTTLRKTTSTYSIVVAPLLLETGLDSLVDYVVVVDATTTQQLTRTHKRDGTDKKLIAKIMRSQLSREERLKRADFILHNQQDSSELEKAVTRLHLYFLTKARNCP